MDEEQKAKVVQLFKEHSNPGEGTGVDVRGSHNVTAGGDINGDVHINSRVVQRSEFTPGPGHITPRQARAIQEIVDGLVKKEVAGGLSRRQAYAKWYGALKRRYRVNSYKAIPAHLADEATSWLKQQSAIKRTKIRRTGDGELWRQDHYRAIWARSRELGLCRGDVYNLVYSRLNKRVTSLKQLSERSLKQLYNIVMSMGR